MATTSLIVEIVVIGAFALIWVILIILRVVGLDIDQLFAGLLQYKDWSAGIILGAVIISYHLGWSVNQLSYFIARKTFNKPIRRKVFKDRYMNFDSIKTTVYMEGSEFIVEKVKERLSVVRITRSAFINFLLISIALFTLGNWVLGFVSLGISVIFFLQANDMYSLYCKQILNAYNIIFPNEEQTISNASDIKKKQKTPSKNPESLKSKEVQKPSPK